MEPKPDPINGWQLAPAWLHWHAHAEAGTCAGRYPRRAGITRCAQGTSGPWVHLGLDQRRYAGAKVTPFFPWVWLCLGPWESPLSLDQVPKKTEHSTFAGSVTEGENSPVLEPLGGEGGPFFSPCSFLFFSHLNLCLDGADST